MARVLIATWPFRGHLLPHIEIGRGLSERGHDVAIYCSFRAAPLIEAEGITYFPYRSLEEGHTRGGLIRTEQTLSWASPLRVMKMCRSLVLDSVPSQIADLEPMIEEWDPDVLVADEIMWSCTLILAEKHALPLAVCSTYGGCMVPGPDAPQFGLGVGPLKGPAGRVARGMIGVIRTTLAARTRRQANEHRRIHGLPPLTGPLLAHAAAAGIYLARGTPEFDYRRGDLPASVHYIGPLVWPGHRSEMTPPWLRDLPRDRPIVYVSEGTVRTREPAVLRAAIEAFSGSNLQVIMTAGGCDDVQDLRSRGLPSNIRLETWVPEHLLLPKTSAVITVGGAGTVLGALAAGVPLLVAPQQSDQPDNGRRVAACGAGLVLPRGKCSPDALRRGVHRLLSEPGFRDNARGMAAVFARYDSRALAAELIEGLAPARARRHAHTHARAASR